MMLPADDKRATITVEEAAELLGIGRSNAYQSVRDGSIPSIRLGKRIVVPMAALKRLLNSGGQVQEDDETQLPTSG